MKRLLTGLACLAVALFLAIALGEQPIPPRAVMAALLYPDEAPVQHVFIVHTLRLPRAVLAALVGAALGVAGTITQAVMRNPLAEPGLLGINGGAALAALAIMLWLPGTSATLVPAAALAGALAAATAIYALSWRGGIGPQRVILIGLGCGAFMGAGTSFLSAFGEVTAVQRAMLWLSGSFSGSGWRAVLGVASTLAPLLALAWIFARVLDLLAMDEAVARGLGLRVQAARAAMVAIGALLCGASVAAAGPVGFIGLMAPHLARRITGPTHAALIPAAALAGALLLLLADVAGQNVIAPNAIPAGIMAALMGAPFFAWLMWKGRHDG